MFRRIAIFVYGTVCYAAFLGVFLYAPAFMLNLFVPKSIDSGMAPAVGVALAVNLGLLGVFGLQHSVMARPGFKRAWTRIVPPEAERSTYVLFSNAAMILLFALWQPLPGVVWELTHPLGQGFAYAGFALGNGLILLSSFLIDHFDLFGMRQVWLALVGKPYTQRPFATPLLYRYIRHPLYVGWFLFFWSTPVMTVGHLLLALGTTAYILVAIVFEERDLLAHFGPEYRAWRKRTPLFIPRLRQRKSPRPGVAEPA